MGLFRKKKPAEPTPAAAPVPVPAATPNTAAPNAATPPPPAAGSAASSAANAPAPAAATTGPQAVTVMDAFGRAMQLPRDQWRKDVLPKMVEANARDPQRLAALVLQGMRDGLSADLLPAALRLTVVDNDAERCLSILAAVQRECGEYEASAATLAELRQKRPDSPAVRVGLALLRDREGKRAEGQALLWEALQQDANHPDALTGWLQWEHARVGDAAFGASLDTVCALPNSWRAQLWRAHRAFDQNRIEDGVAGMRAVIAAMPDESDVLTMAANDFAKAGRHELTAELVLPRYRIERHHPNVGLLLLQHFAATKQPQLGEQLLHELRVRFPRVLDQQLAAFDQEFARQAAPIAQPTTAAQPKVVLYRIDRPLWFPSLGEPEWLLPKKPDNARRVLFASLAVQAQTVGPAMQREDEFGRLSRALPLFLAEQFWLLSPMRGGVALPVADNGGWVVSAAPWAEDRLVQLLSDREREETLLVSGVLRPEGDKRRFDLWVYDCKTKQRVGHAAAEGEAGKLGPTFLQLLAELSPSLGGPAGAKPPVGADAWWEKYATGQAQAAALVIAQLGALPKDRVYGHRAILEWLLGIALEEPRWTPAKLLLSATICADHALGSHVHKELAAPFVELFRMEPPQSAFAKVAVKPLKVLGLMQIWAQRRQEIVAGGDAAYHGWLQRIEAS